MDDPIFTPSQPSQMIGESLRRTVQVVVSGSVILNPQFIDDLVEDIKVALDRDGYR